MDRLVLLLAFVSVGCASQTARWQLEAYWGSKLNTQGVYYIQDYGVQNPADSIRISFSMKDFGYLDSVASAIRLWDWPDSVTMYKFPRLDSTDARTAVFIRFKTPIHEVTVGKPPFEWADCEAFVGACRSSCGPLIG